MRHGDVIEHINDVTDQRATSVRPMCRCTFFLSHKLVRVCKLTSSNMSKMNGNPKIVCETKRPWWLPYNLLLLPMYLCLCFGVSYSRCHSMVSDLWFWPFCSYLLTVTIYNSSPHVYFIRIILDNLTMQHNMYSFYRGFLYDREHWKFWCSYWYIWSGWILCQLIWCKWLSYNILICTLITLNFYHL